MGVGGENIATFNVEHGCRVREVLSKLRDITGLPTFMQALMHGSIEFGRDDLLTDHCIGPRSILTHVVLDDMFFIAGSFASDCTAQIFRISNQACVQDFSGHCDDLNDVNFSREGSSVVTASAEGTVKVWDEATGECLHTLSGHTSAVFSCVFSYDGDLVLTASHDETAKVWDVSNEGCVQSFQVECCVTSAVFHDQEMFVLTASPCMLVQVWCRKTGSCMRTIIGEPSKDPRRYSGLPSPLLSRDGSSMLGLSYFGTATIWCTLNGASLVLDRRGRQEYYPIPGCISDDGSLVLLADENEISCWRCTDGSCTQKWTVQDRIVHCALSDDGMLALVSSPRKVSGTAEVWNTVSGERLARFGEANISSAAFFTSTKLDSLRVYSKVSSLKPTVLQAGL